MEVIIIANGDLKNLDFLKGLIKEDNYIVCADGAAKFLVALEIEPNLLVGDLDSILEDDLTWMKEKGVEIRKFPTKKDFTDSELAVEYAMELKPNSITIIGGIGSRWDHSIGNIMLLNKMLNRGIVGKLMDENNELTITDGYLQMEGSIGDFLSIIPLTNKVKGVTLKGLAYPLTNHNFERGNTLGISNQFTETNATILVEDGVLLVCKSKDK